MKPKWRLIGGVIGAWFHALFSRRYRAKLEVLGLRRHTLPELIRHLRLIASLP